MKLFILKICFFLILIGALLYKLDPFFLDNSDSSTSSYAMLYEYDKNDIDVVFLGNSHQGKGLDTNIINAKCDLNSIKINAGGINIAQIYFNLKEVLNHQSPKLVGIEIWPLIEKGLRYNTIYDEDGKLMAAKFKGEYYKRFGSVKYNEISQIYQDDKLYHMFNFFRFHQTWQDMEDLSSSLSTKFSFSAREATYHNRVNWYLSNDKIEKYSNINFDTDGMFLSEIEVEYLNKIIDLSKKYDFELLFYCIPVYQKYYNKTKEGFKKVTDKVKTISDKHKKVHFYDINEMFSGLNYTYMMGEKVNHNQHLNYKGQIKTSNKLANFINKNFTFKNTTDFKYFDTPENLLYNYKKRKDDDFVGSVNLVNNISYKDINGKKIIKVPEQANAIYLEGWMYKNDLKKFENKNKIVALKKDNDFVYITSDRQIKSRKAPALVNKFGKIYDQSSYKLRISKELLEKGTYTIFHIIKDKDDKYHLKNLYKQIIVQ